MPEKVELVFNNPSNLKELIDKFTASLRRKKSLTYYNLLNSGNLKSLKDIPPPTQRSYPAKAALLESTDYGPPELYESLKRESPNGYIIGIGAGGILSFVNCFLTGDHIKGLVMVDINPHVVAAGRIMVEDLKDSLNAEDFTNRFFRCSLKDYLKKEKEISLPDKHLKLGLQKWISDNSPIFGTQPMNAYTRSINTNRPTLEPEIIDVPRIVIDNYPLLQSLARSGKIAALYANITNPELVNKIKNLPDFETSLNIIYLTNFLSFGNCLIDSLHSFDNPNYPPFYISGQTLKIHRTFQKALDNSHPK